MSWRKITRVRCGAYALWRGASAAEVARVDGHVDGVLFERRKGRGVECTRARRRQHDERGNAVLVSAQPVGDRDAPAVTRHQAREAVLRPGSAQVVADALLVVEELRGDHRAVCVPTPWGSGRQQP